MFGLAAGSRWAGSTAAIRNRPLFAYGILEGAIGAYAVLFPLLVNPTSRIRASQIRKLLQIKARPQKVCTTPAWLARPGLR
jgi:hypothetical protein